MYNDAKELTVDARGLWRHAGSEVFSEDSPNLSEVREKTPNLYQTVRNLHFLSKNSTLISREN